MPNYSLIVYKLIDRKNEKTKEKVGIPPDWPDN
jgi:hypothetical protein